jgi:hypothetical protein
MRLEEENGEKVKANKTKYNLESSVNRFNSQPNETLSRYKSEFKELERIGGGNFGIVYKVINCLDRQQYAVKIILLRGIYKRYITRGLQGVDRVLRVMSCCQIRPKVISAVLMIFLQE